MSIAVTQWPYFTRIQQWRHTLLYACEIWSLSNSSAHSVRVALNNLFRRIFNCWNNNNCVANKNYQQVIQLSKPFQVLKINPNLTKSILNKSCAWTRVKYPTTGDLEHETITRDVCVCWKFKHLVKSHDLRIRNHFCHAAALSVQSSSTWICYTRHIVFA